MRKQKPRSVVPRRSSEVVKKNEGEGVSSPSGLGVSFISPKLIGICLQQDEEGDEERSYVDQHSAQKLLQNLEETKKIVGGQEELRLIEAYVNLMKQISTLAIGGLDEKTLLSNLKQTHTAFSTAQSLAKKSPSTSSSSPFSSLYRTVEDTATNLLLALFFFIVSDSNRLHGILGQISKSLPPASILRSKPLIVHWVRILFKQTLNLAEEPSPSSSSDQDSLLRLLSPSSIHELSAKNTQGPRNVPKLRLVLDIEVFGSIVLETFLPSSSFSSSPTTEEVDGKGRKLGWLLIKYLGSNLQTACDGFESYERELQKANPPSSPSSSSSTPSSSLESEFVDLANLGAKTEEHLQLTLSVLNRFGALFSKDLFLASSSFISSQVQEEIEPFESLAWSLSRILRSSTPSRETLIATSMCLGVLASLIGVSALDSAKELVSIFLPQEGNTPSSALDKLIHNAQRRQHSDAVSYPLLDSFFPFSRLALLRAVLVSARSDALLALIEPQRKVVLELFKEINLHWCRQGGLRVPDKLSAFQCLNGLCESTTAAIRWASSSSNSTSTSQTTLLSLLSTFVDGLLSDTLDLIWDNWDTPIDAILMQVKTVFEKVLDLQTTRTEVGSPSPLGSNSFFTRLTSRLMKAAWDQKGKYGILQVLVRRIGITFVLSIHPSFFEDLFDAFRVTTSGIGSHVGGVLEVALRSLKFETANQIPNSRGQKQTFPIGAVLPFEVEQVVTQSTIPQWLPALISALVNNNKMQRIGLETHGMVGVLSTFPYSLQAILKALAEKQNEVGVGAMSLAHRQALTQVLKQARKQGIVNSETLSQFLEDAEKDSKKPTVSLTELIASSLTHEDEDLRINTLQLLCVGHKSTETTSDFEIEMVKLFVHHNLKASSASFRSRTYDLLQKFTLRLRDGCRKDILAIHNTEQRWKAQQQFKDEKETQKQTRKQNHSTKGAANETAAKLNTEEDIQKVNQSIEKSLQFLNWMTETLTKSMYPGAPFARKNSALCLYRECVARPLLLLHSPSEQPQGKKEASATVKEADVGVPISSPGFVLFEFAFKRGKPLEIFSAKVRSILLRSLWDDFEANRMAAYETLFILPASNPNITTSSSFSPSESTSTLSQELELVKYSIDLISRPQAKDCESAARTLCFLFMKYVVPYSWVPELVPSSGRERITSPNKSSPAARFFEELLLLLDSQLNTAKDSLAQAAQTAPMHGVLLALKYVVSEIDFKYAEVKKGSEAISEWNLLISSLLDKIKTCSRVVSQVVGDLAPEGFNPNVEETEEEEGDEEAFGTVSTIGQMISVCSWRCVKEFSLLIGELVQRIPLPGSHSVGDESPEALMSIDQLKDISDMFLHIMLSTKHKGALERAYIGFAVFSGVLLSLHSSAYHIPGQIHQQLSESILNPKSIVTRRSAGLPHSFGAIMRAEARNRKSFNQHLIPKIMVFLFQEANRTTSKEDDNTDPNNISGLSPSVLSKVHCFNVLRHVIRDKQITESLTQYLGEAIMLAIKGFASNSWYIRNVANMLFGVLADRCVGVKKLRAEARLNCVTFAQFFGRFPDLYTFMLQFLKESTDEIIEKKTSNQVTSLFPILVLLARLLPCPMRETPEPSSIEASAAPTTSSASSASSSSSSSSQFFYRNPVPFISLIRRCATATPDYKVREMAARALVPLVSSHLLPEFLKELLQDLSSRLNRKNKEGLHNYVHGTLLEIHSLLKGHLNSIRNSESMRKKVTQVIGSDLDVLLPQLVELSERGCGPVARVTFDILLRLLVTQTSSYEADPDSNEEEKEEKEIVGEVKEEDSEKTFSLKKSSVSLAIRFLSLKKQEEQVYVMWEVAKTSASNLILGLLKEEGAILVDDMEKVVMLLLSDDDYEVRHSAFVSFRGLVKNTTSSPQEGTLSALLLSLLQKGVFLELLFREPFHENVSELLRITLRSSALTSEDKSFLTETNIEDLWKLLHTLTQTSHHTSTDVKQVAIACQGYVVKQFWTKLDQPQYSSRINYWITLLDEYSSPSQIVNFRAAVARSLTGAKSCFTSCFSTSSSSSIKENTARLWVFIIRLLQDDNEGIRQMMTELVSSLFSLPLIQSSWNSSSFFSFLPSSLCLNLALETVFSYLSQAFSDSAVYFTFLFNNLFGFLCKPSLFQQTKDSNSAEPLFERESDNFWEEELGIIELSSATLSSSSSLHSSPHWSTFFKKKEGGGAKEEEPLSLQVSHRLKSLHNWVLNSTRTQREILKKELNLEFERLNHAVAFLQRLDSISPSSSTSLSYSSSSLSSSSFYMELTQLQQYLIFGKTEEKIA